MRKILLIPAAAAALTMLPAAAQNPGVSGGAVVASTPGVAGMVRTVRASAQVTAIDKPTRTLTLRGPKGAVLDIVAGDEVKNFDQIHVGDFVVAVFLQSLTLELQKVKTGSSAMTHREAAATAKPGEMPAAVAGREITALAKVTAVNKKASTISLKGPRGNVVTLDVRNPDHFKVVKVGDEVLVTYTEAVAVSVEPAPAKPAK
jgi:hypothetical protein